MGLGCFDFSGYRPSPEMFYAGLRELGFLWRGCREKDFLFQTRRILNRFLTMQTNYPSSNYRKCSGLIEGTSIVPQFD
jgi:hypothetical protein